MMVIGQRVSDHVCCFPNRRVSRLRVFDAIRIDSGSSVKEERTPELFREVPEVVLDILKGSK
jgi:hypothetical protein